jgi:hypothetical protein
MYVVYAHVPIHTYIHTLHADDEEQTGPQANQYTHTFVYILPYIHTVQADGRGTGWPSCAYIYPHIRTCIHTVHADDEEQTGPQAGVQWTPDGFVLVRSADVDSKNTIEKAPTQVCVCVCVCVV